MISSNIGYLPIRIGLIGHCATRVGLQRSFAVISNRRVHGQATPKSGEKVVEVNEVKRFAVDVMTAVGTCREHAQQLADVIAEADIRGHYSHGLNRLEMYMNDIKKRVCKGNGEPTIVSERLATGLVNGNDLLGPVVGNFCTDLAVKKAKQCGIGWVVANHSNHFGIAGFYSMRAAAQGCIGLAFTNTSPIMYPTRSGVPALGTNPLTLAVNGLGDDSFVLDMATTTVAIGKVEIANRKGDSIPDTWGVSSDGNMTTDTSKIVHGGGLLPLGGDEKSGGYKGYGLGALVEIFCGVLGGSHWGPNIRKWLNATTIADLGQCFGAIDPDAFAPGFRERMQKFMDTMRNLKTAGGEKVLVAGDPERQHVKLVESCGGIPYHLNQIAFAVSILVVVTVENKLSADLGIKTLKVKRTVE
uniref:Malate dehydrogenase n=1 Tax=Syphacia muris TaxID=451379 RepID=A0A0N5AEU5_9BILA